jgi:hypothetical protein
MSSTNIYNPINIQKIESILKDSNHSLFSTKYSKSNLALNGNLHYNKKLVEFINSSINFTADFVTFQEKLRYYLLDKSEQVCCKICKTPININKVTCSKSCEIEWYKINPKVKESLRKSAKIRKNTYINWVSLLQISLNKTKDTILKKGGYIITDETRQKIKISRSIINPLTGLTPAQTTGKKIAERLTLKDKQDRSIRMKLQQNEIVYYHIDTKEYWTRAKLRSVLLAERLKNTIDLNTGKSLMELKNEKAGKTKRKDCNTSDIKEYRRLVNMYTNRSIKIFGGQLENIKLRSNHNKTNNSYHIDHKFSISEGFHNSIPPFIIGSIYNLQVIPWRDNISKSNKCSIDLEILINTFYSEITKSPIESPSIIDFS